MKNDKWSVALFLALASVPARAEDPPPLKALFFTGGAYHDYKTLAPLLTKEIAGLARVEFDVRWGLDDWKDPQLADPFDVLVFDFCFDRVEQSLVDRMTAAVRGGKPAVFVHCAVHSFMGAGDWTDCCGQKSRAHDPYQAFGTVKVDPEHPVLKAFPDDWKTPGDELYQTIEFGKESRALLKAKSPTDGREHVVCWTREYGKGRVFATTLGHDVKTAAQADYHRLLAHGLLWTCGKLGEDGKPAAGYGGKEK